MADETPTPLSDAEIDRQIDLLIAGLEGPTITAPTYGNIKWLLRRVKATLDAYNELRGLALADIARLAGECDAMREIVAAVAGYDATYCGIELGHECAFSAQQRARTGGQDFGCHWNKGEDDRRQHMFVHGENCLVTRARALLATQTPGTTVEGDPAVCASCGKPAVIHDSGDPYCAQCYHDATGEWPGTTGATAQAGEDGEA